jgi:hypothetical protein
MPTVLISNVEFDNSYYMNLHELIGYLTKLADIKAIFLKE